MNLTPRQARFCEEYLVDLNGTQAAVRAGYSSKTAAPSASRLLINVKVQSQIQQFREERKMRTQITADDVIRGLSDIAQNGKSESARVRSYELLGKHLGMFAEKPEVQETEKPRVAFYIPDNGRGLNGPKAVSP